MIVKEVDYIRGNTVNAPQRKYDDIRKDKSSEEAKKRKNKLLKEKKKKTRNGALQIALVIFILGVLTIWRDTKVYNLQTQIGTLNNEMKL